VLLFDDPQRYRMQVFNRYGEVIFESTDPNFGWKGEFQGSPVSGGAYGYLISFANRNGGEITKKGTVLVIR
jgi:gliding motility-associated-like protein